MPIRPELRHHYSTPEWLETRARILKRAKNRCEQCGKRNHTIVFTYTWRASQLVAGAIVRTAYMIWCDRGSRAWRTQDRLRVSPWRYKGLPRRVHVQLAVAHVDGVAGHDSDENLRAWCQWCHLHHDAPQHKATRIQRKDRARGLADAAAIQF